MRNKDKDNAEKSVLNIHLLELISLRIGQINDCLYCMNMHYNELLELGDSELRLTLLHVWENVPHFSKKERAVLGLTEELSTKNQNRTSEKTFELLRPFFSTEEINRLMIAIKKINTCTWLMKTFGYKSVDPFHI